MGDSFTKHSGIEICEELRSEIDTCYANIVLFVPAPDASVQLRASQSGVNEVVQKNIDGQNFLKRMESIFSTL